MNRYSGKEAVHWCKFARSTHVLSLTFLPQSSTTARSKGIPSTFILGFQIQLVRGQQLLVVRSAPSKRQLALFTNKFPKLNGIDMKPSCIEFNEMPI